MKRIVVCLISFLFFLSCAKIPEGGGYGKRYRLCSRFAEVYIYVVYDQSKEMNENKGSLICIYDWDGNPVELLQFNKNRSCLVIDEKENRGYVIAQDPDDALMYFDL
ncbi:MAG: TolB-like 6-bladed beta-propeller domain-containing protein [Bacteroidales bacterium]|jgi:hypothetical protein|nr:TolB-like 6-bladed beta-propeller domain-containing protein [Bacteroidales bacterium]